MKNTLFTIKTTYKVCNKMSVVRTFSLKRLGHSQATTYPCSMFLQVTSFVFHYIWMLDLSKKLHLFDYVLPFLKK